MISFAEWWLPNKQLCGCPWLLRKSEGVGGRTSGGVFHYLAWGVPQTRGGQEVRAAYILGIARCGMRARKVDYRVVSRWIFHLNHVFFICEKAVPNISRLHGLGSFSGESSFRGVRFSGVDMNA